MNIVVQCFAALGFIALCALVSWIVVVAKEDFQQRKLSVIVQYERALTTDEIDSIRDNLRAQGLTGAVIIDNGGHAHVVWPTFTKLRQTIVNSGG